MTFEYLASLVVAILWIIYSAVIGRPQHCVAGSGDSSHDEQPPRPGRQRSGEATERRGQGQIHRGSKLQDWSYDPAVADIALRTLNMIIKYQTRVTSEEFQSILDDLAIYKNITFNRCWMAEYLPHWKGPLAREVKKAEWRERASPIRYLQIGVFEGLSLLYLTQIILAGRPLEITVIDDFSTEQYFNTEAAFDKNTAAIGPVRKLRADSNQALVDLIAAEEKFDFIYCSGSRKPYVVFVDFALLARLTTAGTFLLLDDYRAYSSYEGDISPDVVKKTFMQAWSRFHTRVPIGGQDLMIWKEVKPDDYTPKQKPPDCVNRGRAHND